MSQHEFFLDLHQRLRREYVEAMNREMGMKLRCSEPFVALGYSLHEASRAAGHLALITAKKEADILRASEIVKASDKGMMLVFFPPSVRREERAALATKKTTLRSVPESLRYCFRDLVRCTRAASGRG